MCDSVRGRDWEREITRKNVSSKVHTLEEREKEEEKKKKIKIKSDNIAIINITLKSCSYVSYIHFHYTNWMCVYACATPLS